jgi:mRNA interferase MazF
MVGLSWTIVTRGKVVLLPFPFDDLSATKVRPAVCLTNPIGTHRHVVVAFVTSQRPPDAVDSDVSLEPIDPAFAATGLRVPSTLRLHRLVTVTTALIARELGELSPELQAKVDARLRALFGV